MIMTLAKCPVKMSPLQYGSGDGDIEQEREQAGSSVGQGRPRGNDSRPGEGGDRAGHQTYKAAVGKVPGGGAQGAAPPGATHPGRRRDQEPSQAPASQASPASGAHAPTRHAAATGRQPPPLAGGTWPLPNLSGSHRRCHRRGALRLVSLAGGCPGLFSAAEQDCYSLWVAPGSLFRPSQHLCVSAEGAQLGGRTGGAAETDPVRAAAQGVGDTVNPCSLPAGQRADRKAVGDFPGPASERAAVGRGQDTRGSQPGVREVPAGLQPAVPSGGCPSRLSLSALAIGSEARGSVLLQVPARGSKRQHG